MMRLVLTVAAMIVAVGAADQEPKMAIANTSSAST